MGSFLKELEQKGMTNQSLRERFNVKDMNHAVISRVISDTRKEGLIKGTAEMQRNIFLFGRKSIWSKELYLFDIKTYLSFRVESVSR